MFNRALIVLQISTEMSDYLTDTCLRRVRNSLCKIKFYETIHSNAVSPVTLESTGGTFFTSTLWSNREYGYCNLIYYINDIRQSNPDKYNCGVRPCDETEPSCIASSEISCDSSTMSAKDIADMSLIHIAMCKTALESNRIVENIRDCRNTSLNYI